MSAFIRWKLFALIAIIFNILLEKNHDSRENWTITREIKFLHKETYDS